MLVVLAIGVDALRVLVLKHTLQSAADAASLAAVSAVSVKQVTGGSGFREVLVLDPAAADIYAGDVFRQNERDNHFKKQGIDVTGFSGNSLDTNGDGLPDSYRMEVRANIESFLFGPLTGRGSEMKVVRVSQTKVEFD